jgi:hypothetical protein
MPCHVSLSVTRTEISVSVTSGLDWFSAEPYFQEVRYSLTTSFVDILMLRDSCL